MTDTELLDWLADPSNKIGNVELPRRCVEENPHSLRAAITAAMAIKDYQPPEVSPEEQIIYSLSTAKSEIETAIDLVKYYGGFSMKHKDRERSIRQALHQIETVLNQVTRDYENQKGDLK